MQEEKIFLEEIKEKMLMIVYEISSLQNIQNNEKNYKQKGFQKKQRIRKKSIELQKLLANYRKISIKNQKEYYRDKNRKNVNI